MAFCLIEDSTVQLFSAIHSGDVTDVQLLLECGADVNVKDENGETPLHAATFNNACEIAQELLDAGADINAQNQNGQTPLHVSCSRGNDGVVITLLVARCDVEVKTYYSKMTALHVASRSGHTWLVKLLLEQGADMDVLDTIRKKPEFYAANEEIRQLFADHRKLRTLEDIPQAVEDAMERESRHINHSMKFSRRHKKLMNMNVFDRLTRQKTSVNK